jgi:hypothetical protein
VDLTTTLADLLDVARKLQQAFEMTSARHSVVLR